MPRTIADGQRRRLAPLGGPLASGWRAAIPARAWWRPPARRSARQRRPPGRRAAVTARPITSRSAPAAIASAGVAARAWSCGGRAGGPHPGHDGQQAGRQLLGLAHVGRGAHHPGAAGLHGGGHPLGEDVRRGGRRHWSGWSRPGRPGAPGRLRRPPRASPRRRRAARRRPGEGVQGQVRRPEGAEHPGGPIDGRGDVGHLEVDEDVVALVDEQTATTLGPAALNSSSPTLATPNQGRSSGPAGGRHHVVHVEGQRQAAARRMAGRFQRSATAMGSSFQVVKPGQAVIWRTTRVSSAQRPGPGPGDRRRWPCRPGRRRRRRPAARRRLRRWSRPPPRRSAPPGRAARHS